MSLDTKFYLIVTGAALFVLFVTVQLVSLSFKIGRDVKAMLALRKHLAAFKEREGFTLLELMIAIVVIGILVAIAVPSYHSVKERAAVATLQSDLHSLEIAEETFYTTSLAYTTDVVALHFAATGTNAVTVLLADTAGWQGQATNPAATPIGCTVGFGDDSLSGIGEGVLVCR